MPCHQLDLSIDLSLASSSSLDTDFLCIQVYKETILEADEYEISEQKWTAMGDTEWQPVADSVRHYYYDKELGIFNISDIIFACRK